MSYFALLKSHRASLGFGFLHAFFSGFGQTFLIALFAPAIIEEFSLTNTAWGLLYASGTLGSAMVFPWVGNRIDDLPLGAFSIAATVLLALASALLGVAPNAAVLLVAIMGLRLGGQAVMTHIAATSVARSFSTQRGRALSLSALGHPAGEALLPLLAVLGLSTLGWRKTSFVMAALCLFVLLPASLALLARADSLRAYRPMRRQRRRGAPSEVRWGLLLRPPLLVVWPAALVPPFLLTGFFLHQESVVHAKGWAPGTLATFFVAFAAARTTMTFFSGRFIDHWSARRLFPFYLAPMGAGLLALALAEHSLGALAFLLGAGLTVGAGTTIKSALWAELFPANRLGAIRSVFSMLTVVSTAVSPALFGWYLDGDYGVDLLVWICMLLLLTTALLSGWITGAEMGPIPDHGEKP